MFLGVVLNNTLSEIVLLVLKSAHWVCTGHSVQGCLLSSATGWRTIFINSCLIKGNKNTCCEIVLATVQLNLYVWPFSLTRKVNARLKQRCEESGDDGDLKTAQWFKNKSKLVNEGQSILPISDALWVYNTRKSYMAYKVTSPDQSEQMLL